MLSLSKPSFLNPTKSSRRLSILLTILNKENPSQRDIAHDARLSSSMVNSYIKELVKQDLLNISKRNKRDLDYTITRQGKKEATNLLLGYSAEIIQLYTKTKDEIASRLQSIFANKDTCKVVLYGASDTCELVIHALAPLQQVHIIGISDSDTQKHHTMFHDYAIIPPETIPSVQPDYVLITSFARQDEIHKSIKHLAKKNIQIIKLSTLN